MATMTHDQLLEYTQGLRVKTLNQIVEGDKVPTDPDSIMAITKMMDGIDRQVLTLKRLAADENNSAKDRDTAVMIANMSNKLARGGNPFFKPGERVLDSAGRLPEITVVEGQMDTGRVTETYSDFIERLEPEGK